MSLIDIKGIQEQARKEVSDELTKKAVDALKKKLKELEAAKDVVRNLERSVSDLEQSIADGSFVA